MTYKGGIVRRMEEKKVKRKFPRRKSKWQGLLLLCMLAGVAFVSVGVASGSDGGFRFTPRDKAYGIHFIDDKRGWIVGDMGLAVMTTDGGENWRQVDFTGKEPFKDIFFVGDAGWIVGDGGLILHSSNGGKSWDKQVSGVSAALLQVFFLDRNKGFAVGADGTILSTDNGGSSWQVLPMDWLSIMPPALIEKGIITINLYDVFFSDASSGWIVGDAGTILHTSDGGKQWSIAKIGPFPALFSVFFKNKREGWAVGQDGYFLITGDGGKSWKNGSLGTGENLYRIFMRGDYGAIVGDHGVMMKTNDGGTTWLHEVASLPPPVPWFADVWILLKERSAQVIRIGKGVMLKTEILPKR